MRRHEFRLGAHDRTGGNLGGNLWEERIGKRGKKFEQKGTPQHHMHAPLARITMFTVCGSHGSLLRCVAAAVHRKGNQIRFGFEMDGTRRGAARARSVRVEIFGDVCGGTVAQLAVAVAASPSDKRNGVGRKRGRSDMKRGAISRLRIHHRALN